MLDNSPFEQFTDKINKDLLAWTLKKQKLQSLLSDYEGTLNMLSFDNTATGNIFVDIADGEGVLCEGKRTDNNIVLRIKQDLYVQLSQKQAIKCLNDLIPLYKDKISVAEEEIRKIMGSMRQVQELMQQYSSIA